MKTKMILACAGMAACAAQAQVDRPALQSTEMAGVIYPDTVQAIKGIRMDGTLVLGEKRKYVRSTNSAARGAPTVTTLYNGAGIGADTDGDGFEDPICGDLCGGFANPLPSSRWFFGPTFATQAVAEDFEMPAAAAAANPTFSGFTSFINWLSCDNSQGTEPMILIFTMYDSVDLVADLDGVNDGFDTDGDTFPDSPYERTDTDGDGLLDQFTGGVIVTFANIDTDGDGNNDVLDAGTAGYYVLFAEELTDTNGDGIVGDPGAVDFGGFPVGDRDGDGNPDGTYELFVAGSEGPDTDGDGNGDSGNIFNQFFATTNVAQVMLWGAPGSDNSGCGWGDAAEVSEGIAWAQGQNTCAVGTPNAGAGFSDGASDGGVVNNFWDPSIDVTDFSAVVPCPDPVGYAVRISGEGSVTPPAPCADTNGDGLVTPADFNAWIIAFNTQSAACDQNGDGLCTPADFNAWIINFNSGAPCP